MAYNLKHRSFLKLLDFTQRDIEYLLDLARDLKRARYGGYEEQKLRGRNIALIFEKASTRTRCAFEVAAYDQGANVTFLDPASSHIGRKESIRDTARVLGRMYDAIEYRGHSQRIVEELARHAGVPVYNGLTDEFHPTQMLADLMTIREEFGNLPNPKDLFIQGTQFGLKKHPFQLFHPVILRGLLIAFVEEFGIRKPGPDHPSMPFGDQIHYRTFALEPNRRPGKKKAALSSGPDRFDHYWQGT